MNDTKRLVEITIFAQGEPGITRFLGQVEAFGDPEDFNNGIGQVGVRILSWREIR